MTPLVLFRLDASPGIGGGHAARCAALAHALAALDWTCIFAGRPETRDTSPALGDWQFIALDPSGSDDCESEATALAVAVGRCDLLVVDHYHRGVRFEKMCRSFAKRILAIDDLADRRHDCDMLLDVTPGRSPAAYADLVPDAAEVLLGPQYALLRPEFAARRRSIPQRSRKSQHHRIVVGFGATDPGNLTAVALDALERCGRPLDIAVMLGKAAPNRNEIAEQAQRMGARLMPHDADPAAVLADADLAIGAGGGSAWERCCLGVPTLMLVAAENQRANAAALADQGAAQVLEPPTAPALAQALTRLLDDPDRLEAMARAAIRFSDGLGAHRIASALDPPRVGNARPVDARPATMDDEALLLDWRSDATARAFARNPRPPGPAEHRQWLRAKLDDPRCVLSIIMLDGKPAGVLRLDWREELGGWEISINVASDARRAGLGTAALVIASRLASPLPQWAFVKHDNLASLRLFARAGFVESDRPGWHVRRDPRPVKPQKNVTPAATEERPCRSR